ncbi:spore germination protein [Niallia taxi]|uniref:spore germination protein n=1 Tax=Niallia taxi TaxID=2499688 RepID=UPI002175532A|nr:spore germination protein [Niallia taxi]
MSFWKKRQTKQPRKLISKPDSPILDTTKSQTIDNEIKVTLEQIKKIFQKDVDFATREFQIAHKIPAVAVFISSLVDPDKINQDIIQCLQDKPLPKETSKRITQTILEDIISHCNVVEEMQLSTMLEGILRGKTVILIEGELHSLIFDTYKPEKRSSIQPETERVVRGPRDGFIEQMMTNISLLRYRLPVPEFRAEQMEIGEITKTRIAICYMDGIASKELVEEVRKRLSDITIDRILDAGYIEGFIQDNKYSPFPQIQNTERPDKAVGNILEGRVVILVDGTPFALIAPATFNQFYHTSEDYNERWLMTSTIRIIRFMALIFSLTFSSFYVTVLSYHPELIPAQFVVAAASGRVGVPFPVAVEVLLMEAAMEILREATVRMPQQVGGALSIVGVLVVGQAAVQAGFVSPITVVIIAMSTIGSFATPSYNAATAFRLLRFPLIVLAGSFGLLGLAVGLMLVINHMVSLRSFGVPYMSPVAPGNFEGIKDTFIRAPLNWMRKRPAETNPQSAGRLNAKNNSSSDKGGNSDG